MDKLTAKPTAKGSKMFEVTNQLGQFVGLVRETSEGFRALVQDEKAARFGDVLAQRFQNFPTLEEAAAATAACPRGGQS